MEKNNKPVQTAGASGPSSGKTKLGVPLSIAPTVNNRHIDKRPYIRYAAVDDQPYKTMPTKYKENK